MTEQGVYAKDRQVMLCGVWWLLEGNPEQPCLVERQGVSRTALG
jgi:hypothetical protein